MLSIKRIWVERGIMISVCIITFLLVTMQTGMSYAADIHWKENTTYKIKKELDLEGRTLIIPHGCKLKFKGGSISNGHIIFDTVKIKNTPSFKNCTFKGTIHISHIDDRHFTSQDDTGTLQFLLTNAIENGVKCDLYRDYKISMDDVHGATGLIHIKNIDSHSEIQFHGNKISNIYPFRFHVIRTVIVLQNVKNVTFRDVQFYDTEEHNSHRFKKSAGCTFIHCFGDCEGINLLNCYQENGDGILRSGVWVHSKDYPELTPTKGLTNSTLKVKAKNTGYGLALYCGDSLDIELDVVKPHRGFYCTGVSNSTIKYKGYDPVESHTHILIKDAVCKTIDSLGRETLDMRGCSNLNIEANIEELLPEENVITFQSYGSGKKEKADFTFRSGKCQHQDIDLTVSIGKYPDSGYYMISNFRPDSGALDENDMYGCKVSGLTIHVTKQIGGRANRYMCNIEDYCDVDLMIDIDEDTKSINSQELGFNIQLVGNCSGKINVKNGSLEKVLVRNKKEGAFDVITEQSSSHICDINYIKDGSSKNLVSVQKRK